MIDRAPRWLLRIAFAVLAVVAVAAGRSSHSNDDGDAKAPRRVAPIDAALAAVQRTHPGRVLKVELENEDDGPDRWVYEVKVLTGDGHVMKVKLDAVSLEQLGVEGGRSGHSEDD